MTKLTSLKTDNLIELPDNLDFYIAPNFIYIEKKNDDIIDSHIYKDEFINDTSSSISGYIKGISKMRFNGILKDAFVIENDFKEERKNNIKINNKFKNLNAEVLMKLLKEKGLNDIHDKIEMIKDKKVLVIDAIDDIPYNFNSLYRIKTYTNELLETIDAISSILNIKSTIIVIKQTNEKSIANVLKVIGMYPNIKVTLSPNKYLLSQKNYLCNYLNIDINSSVLLTSANIYTIREEIYKNKRAVNKIVTIYSDELKRAYVINVLLNTSLKELFDEKNIDYKNKSIFINGTMVGYEVNQIDDIVIDKNINSITILNNTNENALDCINCGACNRICPKNINVKKHFDCKVPSNKCINCGLCNYICPSKINLKKEVLGDKYE